MELGVTQESLHILHSELGGGLKYLLFSPWSLRKMNPFWLMFFKWAETTNYWASDLELLPFREKHIVVFASMVVSTRFSWFESFDNWWSFNGFCNRFHQIKCLEGVIVLASLDEVSGIIDVDEVSSCSDLLKSLKSYTHTWIEQKGLWRISIFLRRIKGDGYQPAQVWCFKWCLRWSTCSLQNPSKEKLKASNHSC